MTRIDDPTMRQIMASRPDASTWLSANAGSGKTKVLTDRVARLLLEGVDPQHILCLTYTKAAASEMQNRLFARLGEWAMLPNAKLEAQLGQLGDATGLTDNRLNEARRLFASAIETPGGLKIQTIHSFCSALLRRFPLEAGVSPHFTEMDERAATLLRAEIVEQLASGPHAEVVDRLARFFTGEDLAKLTEDVVRHRTAFSAPPPDGGLAALFDLPPDADEKTVERAAFLGDEQALIDRVMPVLKAGKASDVKAAAQLEAIRTPSLSALPALEAVFLFTAGAKTPFGAKIGSFPTKETRAQLGPDEEALNDFMARVEDARGLRLSLAALRRTEALYAFAHRFLPVYERAKQARGWLDFDDLILKARDLLTAPEVADWVLYKIDGGIDHILVDEAQDTSPTQWEVIECLGREMSSGQGTRPDTPRTLFVVGDKKQSIYSFQGADAGAFDRMKALYAERLAQTTTGLRDLEMEHSFRSAQIVLDLVDEVFKESAESGFSPRPTHKAFHAQKPGRVDVWPFVEAQDKPDDPEWYDPVDLKSPDNPASILARQVAGAIRDMLGQPLPNTTGDAQRPIEPGDILVLVRRRSDVFHDIIRECKALDLPVAGADRLKVGGELAVRDLGALLSFLATPEDDLSLATALRSPLFGWSEQALYTLAHGRSGHYLWETLRNRREAHSETLFVLDDLLRQVDFLRPYELIERVLTKHDGRRKLLGRLGPEAEDGIDALLAQALAYERNAVDSLTGFLVWMETDDLELKRQMDSAGNRIRVMTVHGAKGLESPIVILPETGARQNLVRGDLAKTGKGVIWRSTAAEAPPVQVEADKAQKRAQEAELDRLLYVAMTRAEQWLIVAGSGKLGKDGSTWYETIKTAMEAFAPRPLDIHGGQGLRLESGNWAGLEPDRQAPAPPVTATLAPYFAQPAPPPAPLMQTLSPSELGGAKALPSEAGLDEEAAKQRGRQVHKLLEVLPGLPEDRHEEAARRLLTSAEDGSFEEDLGLLLAEARKVMAQPELATLFGPDSLAEVPVSAHLPLLGGRRIHGVIDRLILTGSTVRAVDFKTNAAVPDSPHTCPDGLLRQMGAYAHALAQLYPDRSVETALLWTHTATLMPLPHDLVTDALATTQIS